LVRRLTPPCRHSATFILLLPDTLIKKSLTHHLLVLPLVLVLTCFLALPILVMLIVSFCSYDEFSIIFSFTLDNYKGILTSPVIWGLLKNTVYFTAITWAITLVGFTVSY
jgi:putative spermidine/putrescine transport system permease protein